MNPFKKIFPYGRHYIDANDIKAVTDVLKSGMITQGPLIPKTEKKIAKYVGSKYAVLVSSCSAGLHIACKAIGMNSKHTTLTSPITFVSTANSALHCGSKVVLGDIDPNTINLSIDHIRKKIKKNKINYFIPVHFSGLPCDMKQIHSIAKKKKIKIIEDAAHAFGSKYLSGEKVGCCKYSDIAVFSFHPVKIIAGGEAGVVTTNSKDLYIKLLEYRSHGIIKDVKENFKNKKEGYSKNKKNIWYYEMKNLGFHYRQTDIQSALIFSQMKKINKFLNYRKLLAKNYDNFFKNISLIIPYNIPFRKFSSNHLYVIKINFKKLKINRNELMKMLRKFGIITQVHYIPLNYHPYFKKMKISLHANSNAKKYYDDCLSIPLYYGLKIIEQKFIVKKILDLLEKYKVNKINQKIKN
ncbi:MAG: UDP-4-amino-4,6-dideoxy-N-acetyl-beta-L-altrosamine transaminase [Pelagibacteraceae bacterium TMED65]|nr:MAG: UDP-4-amino-4,6-dideoxy-N-acetyl-beta-L-altrosamine transaminase [Pelagibacteraceae bacterium TMED65]